MVWLVCWCCCTVAAEQTCFCPNSIVFMKVHEGLFFMSRGKIAGDWNKTGSCLKLKDFPLTEWSDLMKSLIWITLNFCPYHLMLWNICTAQVIKQDYRKMLSCICNYHAVCCRTFVFKKWYKRYDQDLTATRYLVAIVTCH